jgi:menaquinone-dependent protoporphyrinogen IX oxidase
MKNDSEANENSKHENKQINNYLSKQVRDNQYQPEHHQVKEGNMHQEIIDKKDKMMKCMMIHLGPERNVVQKKAVKNIMMKKIDENISESPLP